MCFNFKRQDHDYSVLHMLVSLVDMGVQDLWTCAWLQIFFPPNLHAPCIPWYRFYFVFLIGFNILGLFILCFLDFCTCNFSFTTWLCQLLYLHCLISTYPNYVCLVFVSISNFFFPRYFGFYVVVNVKVNIQNFLKLSRALHGLATILYIIYYI